ncbi:MAG: hypothetical protein R3D03_08125 [Geminicoccaceae bacterium]
MRAIDAVGGSCVGMVFQKPNPFPKSDLYDNVAYGPRIHGLVAKGPISTRSSRPYAQGSRVVKEVSDRLGFRATAFPAVSSSACALPAIAVSPEVILMDELLFGPRSDCHAHIEELIDELRESFTIAIVTHNMQQAARVSQTTAFFHLAADRAQLDRRNLTTREQMTQDYMNGEAFG